jgi:hypothetical protein
VTKLVDAYAHAQAYAYAHAQAYAYVHD